MDVTVDERHAGGDKITVNTFSVRTSISQKIRIMSKKLRTTGAIALVLIFLASCAPKSTCYYGGGPLIHNKKDFRP